VNMASGGRLEGHRKKRTFQPGKGKKREPGRRGAKSEAVKETELGRAMNVKRELSDVENKREKGEHEESAPYSPSQFKKKKRNMK